MVPQVQNQSHGGHSSGGRQRCQVHRNGGDCRGSVKQLEHHHAKHHERQRQRSAQERPEYCARRLGCFHRDPQSTQIVVFLTTVTFDQFFERFRSTKSRTYARGFQEGREISRWISSTATSLDVSEQAAKITAELKMVAVFAPMMPNLRVELGWGERWPKECTWLAAIPTMAALASLTFPLATCGSKVYT